MIDLVYPMTRPACGNSYQERLHCWQQQLHSSSHVAPWYRRDTQQRWWLP